MSKKDLVEGRIVFRPGAVREILDTLLSMPGDLHPTHHRYGEGERWTSIETSRKVQEYDISGYGSGGITLRAPRATYDLWFFDTVPSFCDGYRIAPSLAQEYLAGMAKARPVFGYCCTHEEEKDRNFFQLGTVRPDGVTAYLGRDTEKFIPGLYWLTLISESLATKHDVPLNLLEEISLEHVDLGSGLHLFRFYDRPEDWQSDTKVKALAASLPGIFNRQNVMSEFRFGMGFNELVDLMHKWD
jgi:hypothetical protein